MTDLKINDQPRSTDVPAETPLLWVLRDELGMTGTKFGCGMALCGACTVHLDGQAIRSCVTPASAVAGRAVHTIEHMENDRVGRAVQNAWV
jgi:isoquinoline 1-oxidoreductase alpha subunit